MWWIELVLEDTKEELLIWIKCNTKFALQIIESTGVVGLLQLLVFSDTILKKSIMKSWKFRVCQLLAERTTGNGTFKAVNECTACEGMSWSQCVSICTDGAAALIGHRKGFQGEVRQVASHVNCIHCIVHKETSASCDLSPQVHILCCKMWKLWSLWQLALQSLAHFSIVQGNEADHRSLVLHSEIRLLSRGKFLKVYMSWKKKDTGFYRRVTSTLSTLCQ
jgi:hypothetical protein